MRNEIKLGLVIFILLVLIGCANKTVEIKEKVDKVDCIKPIIEKYNLTNENPVTKELAEIMLIQLTGSQCSSGDCEVIYMEKMQVKMSNSSKDALNAYYDYLVCAVPEE